MLDPMLLRGPIVRKTLAVLAALLLAAAAVGWWVSAARRHEATRWVRHTGTVQLSLARVERHLDAIAFPRPGTAPEDAQRALAQSLASVRALVSDNAAQVARVDELEALKYGPAREDDRRALLAAMEAEEARLREVRIGLEGAAERRSSVICAVSAGLAVVLLLLALHVERRNAMEALTAERAVRLSEERLRHVTEHVSDLVWVHGIDGTRLYVSPSCVALLGYTPAEMLRGGAVLHPDDAAASWAAVADLAAGRRASIEVQHRILTKAGSYRWFNSRMRVSLDESGKPNAIHTVSRDETERRGVQEHLLIAKDAAESATRAKSDFLARMSHEIRTPMNGVLGMTELALQTQLTSEQREYIGTARASAASLLEIIDSVLDFSKIEAGKLRLESVRFALRSSVGRSLRALAVRAHEKGLALLLRIDDQVPDSIVGDPHRLSQLLVNLVSNSIKFTDRGEIVVHVTAPQQAADRVTLLFRVEDSGIGIADEKLAHIFDAFAQAEESTTRNFGGTGLGLTICKQLAAMMNGQITVESTLGQGSVFRFSVEVADPLRHAPDARIPTAVRGTHVLVLDPSSTSRAIISELLAAWGVTCDVAENAMDGSQLLAAGPAGSLVYDMVIADGAVDSAAAVALCRLAGASRVPLLMIGAHFRGPDDLRVGCVSKPVFASDLLETMEALLSGSGRATPLPTRLYAREVRKILLVEDNAVNRKVAMAILERAGHEVVAALNGRLALAALAHDTFDVVLMDVQMPEMDGLEATRRIRAMELKRGGHLPIIALTAQAMQGDREICMQSGMDAYVRKPLSATEVLAVIDTLTASASDAGVVDRDALLNELGDDSLVAEVVAMYLAEAPQLLLALETAVAGDDTAAVGRAAHELKGTLANMRCGQASRVACEIEGCGRSGDVGGARARLVDLRRALQAVERALAA